MARPQPSPMARRMDSIYPLPQNAKDPLYGVFPGCQILGDPCTIKVTLLRDRDSRATDILGFSAFRRGGVAIHISGKNDFGVRDSSRRIGGIGMLECVWDKPGRHPSGTGCAGPEPVVVLAGERHFAHWSRADAFVTLEGIYHWDAAYRMRFTAEIIAASINQGRESYMRLGAQQVSAIRRLLEASVGATNHGIVSDDGKAGVARLMRAGGRYQYRWIQEGGNNG